MIARESIEHQRLYAAVHPQVVAAVMQQANARELCLRIADLIEQGRLVLRWVAQDVIELLDGETREVVMPATRVVGIGPSD